MADTVDHGKIYMDEVNASLAKFRSTDPGTLLAAEVEKATAKFKANRTVILPPDPGTPPVPPDPTPPPPPPTPPPGGSPGAVFHTSATQPYIDSGGNVKRFRGVNIQQIVKDNWTSTWSQSIYDKVAAAGFKTLRSVLWWDALNPSSGDYNDTLLATLDTAIGRAANAGLYVYFDMVHLYNDGGWPAWASGTDGVNRVQNHAGPYMAMIANRYKNNPTVIGYDPVNEPDRWPNDINAVLSMYNTCINAIRAVDAHKLMYVEATFGNQQITGANFNLITNRSNLIFSLHDYYVGGGKFSWDASTGYYGTYAELENWFLKFKNVTDAAGIPIQVGECGIAHSAAGRDRLITDKTALYRKYGVSFDIWEMYANGGSGGLSLMDPSQNFRPHAANWRL